MPVGDIRLTSIKVGDIDLSAAGSKADISTFNIYENILSPYGPLCDLQIIDHGDALGSSNLNGSFDKDIELDFSTEDGAQAKFKFKMLQNKNLDDGARSNQGSGHNKQYNIRGIQPEALASQGNPVEKSYKDSTSNMVKDIVKNYFKSDKQVEIGEQTKGKRRMVFGGVHPLEAIKTLDDEHEAQDSQSSTYTLFQRADGGQQKYVFTTFEKLFQQSPVATLSQSSTLNAGGTSEQAMKNSILWINVSDSFNTLPRAMSTASEQSFNMTTHRVTQTKGGSGTKFKTADGNRSVYSEKAKYAEEYPVGLMHDKVNEPQRHNVGDAKRKRAEFLSHLAQNSAELEIIGNPNIKLGSMVNLNIPAKVDGDGKSGEKQFNGKALVVGIRHKIKTAGEQPRYTMVLRVVKASYKEGGGGAA